ncbi:MAG TPA: type 2 lanthipeptide synthetase LanM family protein [Actinoallomurus sp.]|nr:type 2 lanthipeptide synthetase LanM family protein [Actinoallomurus sp.]
MSDHSFLDIAASAANLSERTRIVAVLRAAGTTVTPGVLPPFDAWKIDRLAGRLAQREAMRRTGPGGHTRDDLAGVLTAYRHHELVLGDASEETRAVFIDVHESWLPTYQAALRHFDRSAAPDASWRRSEVYYGRPAIACEPFLTELGRRLEVARASHPGRIGPRLIDDFQRHLLDRFELSLAWAVEADANTHCARTGIDKDEATREEYLAYLDATFADAAAYHRFYLRFPVLGRWLAEVTSLLAGFGSELIDRFAADRTDIGRILLGEEINTFLSVRLGLSDHHAGARSVAIAEVELAGGGTGSFVYKPRCIRSEAAMQELLGRLRDDGVLGFAPRPVLPRSSYGYEALIPAGRNHLSTQEEVERVYAELGGYLSVFYVLGGGDLHFENILIADGHAFVCDCETALGVLPRGQARPAGTLLDSVFKTGLLEWPRTTTSATEMRIRGYAGGEAYDMPIAVPRVNEHRLSFRASVTHRSGVRVEPPGSNRVFLGDRLTRPQDFTDAIMDGFGRVYAWFEERPDEAARDVSEIFSGASARFINWGTQVYAQLLISARHPKCLVDPLEVDLLVSTVRTFPRTWDTDGTLAQRELESMWRLDVPIFTAEAGDRQLVHDHAVRLPSYLEVSPIEGAGQRIGRLSRANRAQQSQYIAASLSSGEVAGPAFVTASIEYATRIGERLCRMLRDPSAPAPWTSYGLTGGGMTEVDVDGDLYHGSAGIALFLAYLGDLVPRPEFRRAAGRALSHAVTHTDRRRAGAFQGLGGLIYVLTHLHHLWEDRGLLELAVRLSDELPWPIDADTHFDVLSGAAGLIPVLLGLGHRTGGQGLEHAHRCADLLLRHAVEDGDTLSWPPADPGEATANLTGFSHGAGGIGWALIQLGAAIDDPAYVDAGRRAFTYEARHFDESRQDWYDLRTSPGGGARDGRHFANAWCNGAAGIGLSRIASWATLGGDDELLLREAHQALAATMRGFPRLMNDTLCHGRTGNAELFLRFAVLRDEPAFRLEANVQVQEQWRHLDDAENAAGEGGFFPGLMLGLSGFGMHFLRLARPDRVPSVLLLDPVPSRQ